MTECIRIQLEGGLPQHATLMTTYIFVAMAEFCAQPESFPVFHAWLITRVASAPDDIREAIGDLTPGIVGGFGDYLAEGVTQ